LVSISFYFLAKPLLRLVRTPENIIDMATDYISIIYLFLNSAVFYNLFSSVLRALGDSKSPVIFLLISSILNIILDLFFVIIIPLAAKGVAIATVIAQGISAILSFIYINAKFPVFRTKRSDWYFDKKVCKRLLQIGIPGAMQFSVCAVGVIIVQAFLNGFGSDAIAAYSVGCKIENVMTQFFPSLGIAISTYIGQNLGAEKIGRLRKGFSTGLVICSIYAVISTIVIRFISAPLALVFVESGMDSQSVIDMAVKYSVISSYFYIPLGMIFVYRSGSQGLGSGSIPIISSIIELAFRIISVAILPKALGYIGICLASPAAWIGAGFILPFFAYKLVRKIESGYRLV
jgi:putative MATE family efflux protein